MGNGESTSRRIALQKSDEGTIQISEDVMYRLKGISNEDQQVSLKDGETVIHEDELKYMVEDAFLQGRKHEHERMKNSSTENISQEQREKFEEIKRDLETKLEDAEKRYQDAEKLLAGDENYLKKEELENQIRNEVQDKLHVEEERHQEEVKTLKEEIEKLNVQTNDNKDSEELKLHLNQLQEEKDALENKLTLREKEIQEEFSKSVADIERQIKPLESTPVCMESQKTVLECYRLHKTQTLKCAKEVKDFIDCVQAARMKHMQKKLLDKP